jgi:hypothetical protein
LNGLDCGRQTPEYLRPRAKWSDKEIVRVQRELHSVDLAEQKNLAAEITFDGQALYAKSFR